LTPENTAELPVETVLGDHQALRACPQFESTNLSVMNFNFARILVVDDDEVMRTFVVNSLRRLGLQQIETAVDGGTALQAIVTFKPDLVLTDIHMQPMDGLAFVRQLRSHSNHMVKHMKVIFMSADASAATLKDAMPLGTFGYIVKPPRLDTLKEKIEAALK